MIRLATEQDIVELKQLWDESFDDPMNYLDFIYSKAASPSDTLVYDMGDTIASMMTLIPVNFVYGYKAVRTIYIYGAATNPRYQNKGVMTRMLSYAEDHARMLDCHLSVLVPGEPYLFDFYKSRGYSADFNCRIAALKPGMIPDEIEVDRPAGIDTITGEQAYRLRAAGLADTPHIEWSAEQMEFVLEDCRIYGEHVAHYRGMYGESYAVFHQEKRKMHIKECFGDSPDACYAVLKDIIQQNGPRTVRIQLPVDTELFPYAGSVVRYGMAKPLNVSTKIKDLQPYMNLMLD